ncbi:MAG: hypothetical protein V8R01_04705 [Bacilli bacterium]
MSNKQNYSGNLSDSKMAKEDKESEPASLIGIEAHKVIYKDFYDYVRKHEKKYSKPRNLVRVGAAIALVSGAAFVAYTSGADTLVFSGGTLLIGSYLYGLHVKSDYNMTDNCRQVINHHNLVIDYLNDNGMTIEDDVELRHNETFPIDILEEVDNRSLTSYVNGELERQKRNREAGNKPAIIDKTPRANREGKQIIYSTHYN